ncbi:MAG: hypothetical protein WBN61_02335 [Woeseiaceae bacterium]
MRTAPVIRVLLFGLALIISAHSANAEPYLAVQKGMHCSSCHSHPAGGGKRSVYGNVFAQAELAGRKVGQGELWTGEVTKWFAVGGNLRASYVNVDIPNRSTTTDFDFNRGTLYLEATIIPNRLSVYLDEQFSPDGLENREAYVRLNSRNTKWFLTAGQFYLPYGLRLQDDSSFVRQASGINFANSDRGLQGGYTSGPWSAIASVTDGSGTGGSGSSDQVNLVTSYVQQQWRAGFSANVTNSDGGDRNMFGLFGGLRTGPIAWLAEIDHISDEVSAAVTVDAFAGLLEANWTILNKHNLKISYDYLDPDTDTSEDQQVRYSLVWEHSPLQFIQGRAGVRLYDGIPQVDSQNRKVFFAEIHGFF